LVENMSSKPFYLNQEIDDFDQFCESARRWDLDFRQLEAGPFSGQLLMFGNARLNFTRCRLSRKILQHGATPKGLVTFGILANAETGMFWRNIAVDGSALFVFPPDGELLAITQPDFDVFAISIAEDTLESVCTLLELPDFKTLVNQNEVFKCHPKKMLRLRHLLFHINQILNSQTGEYVTSRFLIQIEQELAVQLLSTLSNQLHTIGRKSLRKRDVSLKAAESYIYESSGAVPSIPEICAAAHASQRMLEYAFKERYGMTPQAFVLMERLNRVRKQLRSESFGEHRISDIAREHGFSHMGQFGANYKKLFAESPSSTLKNRG
jgi:AraC family ethanolamine operon transcriptional activator